MQTGYFPGNSSSVYRNSHSQVVVTAFIRKAHADTNLASHDLASNCSAAGNNTRIPRESRPSILSVQTSDQSL
jgi:hypothetical protein